MILGPSYTIMLVKVAYLQSECAYAASVKCIPQAAKNLHANQ